MADEWEDVAYGPSASSDGLSVSIEPWTSNPSDSAWEDVEPTTPSPIAKYSSFDNVSSQIGKGTGLGFFDEFQGAEYAARNAIANLFGRGNGLSLADSYNKKTEEVRYNDALYREENPKTAFALNMGGAMLPAIVSAPLTAGATATGLGARAIGDIFGAGIKSAPTLGRLAEMGIVGGGITGAGEASPGNRLEGAGWGSAIGGVFGPVAGTVIKHGTNFLGDLFSPFISRMSPAAEKLSPEAGAINLKLNPSYTPEELYIAKQLKNTPVDKVLNASVQMNAAAADNAPLFLPEALNSAKITRNARAIANNEFSMDAAQAAIEGRTAGSEGRLLNSLIKVAPEESSFSGALKMITGADSIINKAEEARLLASKPFYEAAYKARPVVYDSQLTNLIESDQHLARAIADVKKHAVNSGMPDNATPVLIKARSELGDKIENAIAKGETRKARDLTDTYSRLNNILHKEENLVQADMIYSGRSHELEALNETFLKNLSNISPDKVKNVGQVLDLPTDRIRELRQTFVDAGKLDEWNAGIRAHLQNSFDNTNASYNWAERLIGTPAKEAKLGAALGEKADDVIRALKYESRFYKGKNLYNAGSSTAGNLAEERSLSAATEIVGMVKSGDIPGLIGKLFGTGVDDEMAQNLAKIYFTSGGGKNAIDKILPLVKQYARNKAAAEAAGKGATVATSRLGGVVESLKSPLQRNDEILAPASTPGSLPTSSTQPIKSAGKSSIPSTNNTTSSVDNLASDLFSKPAVTKKDIAAVESLIDSDAYDAAVYEVESSRNPKAKNKTSSAAGGFQLINSTAKALGVKDPYDLAQNYQGFLKLKQENMARFGDDPRMLYAAHFLGGTVLGKLQRGDKLTAAQQKTVDEFTSKALPRFLKIYSKIQSKQVEA